MKKESNEQSDVSPTLRVGAVGGNTVSVMIRVIDNYPATPWRTSYETRTRAYRGAMHVKSHKWNKSIVSKRYDDALALCEKWKAQLQEEGRHYWQQ